MSTATAALVLFLTAALFLSSLPIQRSGAVLFQVTIITEVVEGLPTGQPTPLVTLSYIQNGSSVTTTIRIGGSKTLTVDANTTVSIDPIVEFTSRDRYTISGSRTAVISTSGSTVTFRFSHQYYLSINTPEFASKFGVAWYAAGSSASFSVNSPVPGAEGIRYVFDKWTGDHEGTSPSGVITMNGPKNITAVFKTQYYLTIIGGGSTAGDGWYDSNSDATTSTAYVWDVVSTTSRSSLVSWKVDATEKPVQRAGSGTFTTPRITMTSPKSITFNSITQYYLSLSGGNEVSYGTPSQTGDGWFDSGTVLNISTDYSWRVVTNRSRSSLTSWSLDRTENKVDRRGIGRFTTGRITMSEARAITFSPITQYYLSVRGGFNLSFKDPSPTGDVWYDEGASVTVSSDILADLGSGRRVRLVSYTIDDNLVVIPRSSGRFETSRITMIGPHNLRFNGVYQYLLSVTGGNNVIYSLPSPNNDNWYDDVTRLTVSTNYTWSVTEAQSRINLVAWNLDGKEVPVSRSSKGPFTTPLIDMTGSRHLRFVSTTQHFLDIRGGFNITFSPPSPTRDGWFDEATSVRISANHVWNTTESSRHNLASWSLAETTNRIARRENSGSFSTPSLEVTKPNRISFNHVIQHLLSVRGGSDITYSVNSPTRDNWYDKDTSLSVSTSYVWSATNDTRSNLYLYRMDTINDEAVPRRGGGRFDTTRFSISSARLVTFKPVTQHIFVIQSNVSQARLSLTGSQTGDIWFDFNSTASFGVVSAAIPAGEDTKYVFIGWSGLGRGSYTGPALFTNVKVVSGIVENAFWITQYSVKFQFLDSTSQSVIRPTAVGITNQLGRTYTLTNQSYFADKWSSWTIDSVVWANIDVAPVRDERVSYKITSPINIPVKLRIFPVKISVRDIFGASVSGVLTNVTFANGTYAITQTSAEGTVTFERVPLGTFTGFVNFLGDYNDISAQEVGSKEIAVQITFSRPILTLILSSLAALGIVFYIVYPRIATRE